MSSWYSQNSFGESNPFDDHDIDAAMGCVPTPSSTHCTPQEDTSDEQGFLGDLNTPSHSVEDGVSEAGPMIDFLMSNLVSPRSAHRMTAVFATLVDEEEPGNLYSTLDHVGTDEANTGTYARDSNLKSARPSAQGIVFYSLLDSTIDIMRRPTSCHLHTDSMANQRIDLSQ